MHARVSIHGGGLAGSAAAIAARMSGAPEVCVYEQSALPRHKVCGEFLTSGVEPVLRGLGVWHSFLALGPARIPRLGLHFPGRSSRFTLPEPCWGLSRYALDECLMRGAINAGAEWRHQAAPAIESATVLAHGRRESAPKGKRVFGFKAHHEGPDCDSVDLYFFDGCYVGVAPVERGVINVCGLGPETLLREHGFRYDALCERSDALRARLQGMERRMDWLSVGPLVYRNRFRQQTGDAAVYPAGDALGFVDPFTGTGMFNALLSGSLAGRCAAEEMPVTSYLRQCRGLLHRPFLVSSWFRAALRSGLGERFAGYLPAPVLFQATRAHLG